MIPKRNVKNGCLIAADKKKIFLLFLSKMIQYLFKTTKIPWPDQA